MEVDRDQPALRRTEESSWAEPPGGILVWIIVVVELLTFGMGLIVFQVQAAKHPDVFDAGRTSLSQTIGMINTVILLTGGWFMTIVMNRLRTGDSRRAANWLAMTLLSGFLFLALKGFEYVDKLNHGQGLHADAFYTLYWLLTVFHFIHVSVAMVLLLIMWWGIRVGRYTIDQHEDVESSGIFWHMCDLIWLFVYPVIYLL